jgi:hypothetical protein
MKTTKDNSTVRRFNLISFQLILFLPELHL